jgi:hypothetical protein
MPLKQATIFSQSVSNATPADAWRGVPPIPRLSFPIRKWFYFMWLNRNVSGEITLRTFGGMACLG